MHYYHCLERWSWENFCSANFQLRHSQCPSMHLPLPIPGVPHISSHSLSFLQATPTSSVVPLGKPKINIVWFHDQLIGIVSLQEAFRKNLRQVNEISTIKYIYLKKQLKEEQPSKPISNEKLSPFFQIFALWRRYKC